MKNFWVLSLGLLVSCALSGMEKPQVVYNLGQVYKILMAIRACAKEGEVSASVALYEFERVVKNPQHTVHDSVARYWLLSFGLIDEQTGKLPQRIREWLTQEVEMA